MKRRYYFPTSISISIFVLSASFQAFASVTAVQPPVSRRMITCDGWQWIGGEATTWGCFHTPREVHVAGGEATDQVIASLQKQISDLEARIKIMENKNPNK